MDTVVFTNLLILLGMIPVGLLVGWGILRGLDKLCGISFKNDVLTILAKSPKATAIYFSVRFAAVMYLVAALTGRFV